MTSKIPDHCLIIGAGEFGLSTALALLKRGKCRISIVDASATLPNPSGTSVDASRIIRADYACKPYAALAAEAQVLWRDQTDSAWGGQGRYSQTGFALTAFKDSIHYVSSALENVEALANEGMPIELNKIERLDTQADIRRATRYEHVSGDAGYVNWNSGWAHAEKVVQFAMDKLLTEGGDRVDLRKGAKVERLLITDGVCKGAVVGGEPVFADLTIVAAGAWSPSLVDLEGRCVATGQALAFIDITAAEQTNMGDRPVIMNLSNGMFIIPPENCHLKVARHGFGHINLLPVTYADGTTKTVSVPLVGIEIPEEAQEACRSFLRDVVPEMAERPFIRTRLCWYCDTTIDGYRVANRSYPSLGHYVGEGVMKIYRFSPDGDFLIDYHPGHRNLFLATGGSGHGFKFFPVLGERIVDQIEGKLDHRFSKMWSWRECPATSPFYCEDGSRAGSKGLHLDRN